MAEKIIKVYKKSSFQGDGIIEYDTRSDGQYEVSFLFNNKKASGVGLTLFDALVQVRNVVEPFGYLLGIKASSRTAGNVFNSRGSTGDLVATFDGLDVNNVFALSEEEPHILEDVSHQKRWFDEKHDSYLKLKDVKSDLSQSGKEIRKNDVHRHVPVLSAILTLLSISYPFLLISLGREGATVLGSASGIIGWYWLGLIVLGVLLYSGAICVALENVLIKKRSTFNLFCSIALPIVSIIFVGVVLLGAFLQELQKFQDALEPLMSL